MQKSGHSKNWIPKRRFLCPNSINGKGRKREALKSISEKTPKRKSNNDFLGEKSGFSYLLAGFKKSSDLDRFVDEQYLASGSFGKIYSAKIVSPWRNLQVAIKKVPIAERGYSNALKEAEILR